MEENNNLNENEGGFRKASFMDANFQQNNYQQDNYQQTNYQETNYEKSFGDSAPIHNPQAVTCAKQAMVGAAAVWVGGIATFIIALLTSSFYVALAAVAPVGVIIGLIYTINAIRLDKGVPLAYVALVLNVLGIVPAVYSAWLIISSLIYF